MRKQVIVTLLFVFLVRLPFLNQAIQGDDYFYLAAAQHAQIDPAHPHHAEYVFLGERVSMRGHPHPPGDAWILAGLLAVFGDIHEVPFHLAYLVLSWLAALSMLALARRFVPERALEATLLFCSVPAFLVNGNSFESDLPFLAFWMLSFALIDRPRWAALAIAGCALMAYQSVLLIPILAVWLWQRGELKRNWWLLTIPALVLAGYQLFELAVTGQLPILVLNQHFQTYKFQSSERKIRSAIALTGHLVVMFTPIGFWALLRRREKFLSSWVVLFFAAALVLFFAGSARYLLPLGAPFAMLVALHYARRPVWIWSCLALQLALGMSLAWVNYEHWQGYREFAREAMREAGGKRVWVNADWGLRFYAEAEGALPIVRGQALRPGDWVIGSKLSTQVDYTTGGGQAVERMRRAITPSLPLRIIGLGSRSGYSSADFGLWPFDISTAPVDEVTLALIVERKPELSWLPMNAPSAEAQIVSGLYSLEENKWRWTGQRAVVLVKPPPEATPLVAEVYLPESAPGRTVVMLLNGKEVARQTFAGPDSYRLESAALSAAGDTATVELSIDRDFSAPGDNRKLGFILTAVGFAPKQ